MSRKKTKTLADGIMRKKANLSKRNHFRKCMTSRLLIIYAVKFQIMNVQMKKKRNVEKYLPFNQQLSPKPA